jgi:hypothetical protein
MSDGSIGYKDRRKLHHAFIFAVRVNRLNRKQFDAQPAVFERIQLHLDADGADELDVQSFLRTVDCGSSPPALSSGQLSFVECAR